MTDPCFIGIDVGTGSVRAGVVSLEGRCLAHAVREIRMWNPEADFAEQSTDDIWRASCEAVRQAMADSGIPRAAVRGIGFDATCSLALLDGKNSPVTVSREGDDNRNVIVWMDHRAREQAERINRISSPVLRFVGGRISPEMQLPKLLWVKENLPDTWKRTARFFDLPDFLTYRATGSDTRSLCTTVCKWTYLGHEADGREGASGWDESFFHAIGLGDLSREGFRRIGRSIEPMGKAVGEGLTVEAAREFGLEPGTAVSVAVIDAHAGGIGMIGMAIGDEPVDFNRRLALIGGTSSCHMAVSQDPRFIDGVWGPYFSAMVPGYWLTEGGQSATGALVDHVLQDHAASLSLEREAAQRGITPYAFLNETLERLAGRDPIPGSVAADLHLLPDFHGNRSPRADPSLKGSIIGLTLDRSLEGLACRYLAAIQAIAYGTRHILDVLGAHGYAIDTLIACGGGTKNPVFLREHADATGCRLILPDEPEAVLLGSAILGAVASGQFSSIPAAMEAMSRPGKQIDPTGGETREFHRRKYEVFHRLHHDFQSYRKIMEG